MWQGAVYDGRCFGSCENAYRDVVYDARIDREAASVAARRHTAAQRVRLEVLYLPYTACLGLRGSCEACRRTARRG